MPLSAGTRLGSYEIAAPLGKGGMGEVYRAKDSKLGREVAIKVLPGAFAKDPERLARFDQEARLLAALNHPNIAAIYGLEESDGVRYLALELVPGDTLAERIARGPLPVDEALTLCRQIAEALEAAHERGIIHRDLKPANVKVTPDGKVKVLDFGLAKAFETDPASGDEDLSQSPTASFRGSKDGVILGTAAYMSPEQARGKPVDKRTDIWSFGCVLYEVLTGKQAFAGETASDTISAILKDEPDWNRMPQASSAGIRRLLRRCLAKNQRERLHDIADARIEIDESTSASDSGHSPEGRGPVMWRRRVWWVALGAAVGGFALGLGVVLGPEEPAVTESSAPVRFGIDLPLVRGQMKIGNAVISPDGATIVYSGYLENNHQLYVRSLNGLESRPIAGTEGASMPFFSPDGRWIGFFAGGKIKKISIRGGQPLVVCDASQSSPGAIWGPDNSILFSTWNSGLQQVSADGGRIETLTTPDEESGEMGHWWPEFLPGGRKVLFTVWTTAGSLDLARIKVFDLATGRVDDIRAGASARYVPTGHLIYYWGGMYHAAPFSVSRLELTGEPVPVLEAVRRHHPQGSSNRFMSFSGNGTLVYVPGRAYFPLASLHWVNHSGGTEPYPLEPQVFTEFSIAPDNRRVALTRIHEGRFNIWVHDPDRGTYEQITQQANNTSPVWHPDGEHLFFQSSRRGNFDIYMKRLNTPDPPIAITDGREDEIPQAVTPDGKSLLIGEYVPGSSQDLWLHELGTAGMKKLLVRTPVSDNYGTFSPDGQWLAYVSNISGREEVYVKSMLVDGGELRISTEGGTTPIWSPTKNELYYSVGDKLLAVPYAILNGRFSADRSTVLLSTHAKSPFTSQRDVDVSRDGRRFLTKKLAEGDSFPDRINVVLNWFEELKRRVPAEESR